MVAKMEAKAFFGELGRRVESLELAGTPERWISGGLASTKVLPVRAHARATVQAVDAGRRAAI
jgi:hypothetical protein